MTESRRRAQKLIDPWTSRIHLRGKAKDQHLASIIIIAETPLIKARNYLI